MKGRRGARLSFCYQRWVTEVSWEMKQRERLSDRLCSSVLLFNRWPAGGVDAAVSELSSGWK